MGALLQELSVVQIALLVYAALAFTKILLNLSSVHVAAKTMQESLGGRSFSAYLLMAVVLTTFFTIVMLVPTLYREKLRFFLAYTDEETREQTLSGL